MFTGENSQPSQNMKPTKNYQTQSQWSLNPSTYQNLSNEEVDWAALAQQWIQMKETYPPELVPSAPPPPPFIKDIKEYEEQGEAPMEVEKDDEFISSHMPQNGSSTNWTSAVASSSWNTIQNNASHWRTGWNSWSTTGIANPQANLSSHSNRPPLLPSPNNIPSLLSTTTAPAPEYWTSKSRFSTNTDIHHSNKDNPCLKTELNKEDEDENSQTLDAAKRKSLPAWIREGLEKMEREKQKQEEKERERRERETILEQRRIAEEEAMKELAKESLIPRKSKFDSDSEDEYGTEEKHSNSLDEIMGKKKYLEKARSKSPELLNPYRTREEIIQDLMLSVRKNLTEILLEVTNEEILEIALETITKAKKKAPTTQAMRKTATTSLSVGLGLGIYDDSTDESDSNSGDEKEQNDDNDSDIELQEIIKRRKAAFEKTSREIEAQLAEQEEREERRRRERELILQDLGNDDDDNEVGNSIVDGNNKRKHYHEKDGETLLHDKNNMKFGRSSREKKPSRFSDPKDIVKNVQTHVSILPNQQNVNPPNELKIIENEIQEDVKYTNESSNSSSDSAETTLKRKDKKSSRRSTHKKRKSKYYDHSDNSDDSSNEDSHKSSSRRSRSRDYYVRSDRSEESRSSYHRRERSRSRSRDKHHRSSSDRYRSSKHHYDYDSKYRSRSKSRDRYHKSHRDHSRSKERSSRHSESRTKESSSSSSRHKY